MLNRVIEVQIVEVQIVLFGRSTNSRVIVITLIISITSTYHIPLLVVRLLYINSIERTVKSPINIFGVRVYYIRYINTKTSDLNPNYRHWCFVFYRVSQISGDVIP